MPGFPMKATMKFAEGYQRNNAKDAVKGEVFGEEYSLDVTENVSG
jgi:hypothetical protein